MGISAEHYLNKTPMQDLVNGAYSCSLECIDNRTKQQLEGSETVGFKATVALDKTATLQVIELKSQVCLPTTFLTIITE